MNKKHIKLTESDLHKIVKESVNKVLGEGTIPKDHIISALKEYISDGDLRTVLRTHPQLVDVIANWLAENGENEFLSYVAHNFLNGNQYD